MVDLQQADARDLSPALIGEPGARLAALVKLQFEVGRAAIGKGGIVRPGIENSLGVAQSIGEWRAAQPGWRWTDYMKSPISGGDGNMEFLLGAIKSA